VCLSTEAGVRTDRTELRTGDKGKSISRQTDMKGEKGACRHITVMGVKTEESGTI